MDKKIELLLTMKAARINAGISKKHAAAVAGISKIPPVRNSTSPRLIHKFRITASFPDSLAFSDISALFLFLAARTQIHSHDDQDRIIQSSILRPGTRENLSVLCVITESCLVYACPFCQQQLRSNDRV